MEIRPYSETDELQLFDLMRSEGDDWKCYFDGKGKENYKKALGSSLSYVAFEDGLLVGFIRCRDDDGLAVYIYDLLVQKAFRGHSIGRQLMERVCSDFPEAPVYVLSGVDAYYKKLGYPLEGSIFKVDVQHH